MAEEEEEEEVKDLKVETTGMSRRKKQVEI